MKLTITNLEQAVEALTSSNHNIRMGAACQAVERKFWFATPPAWFNSIDNSDVIGFDDKNVIVGTSFRNIKLVSWSYIESKNQVYEEFLTELVKKVA